jgi:phosphoribosylformimino-5-aminoimidazole carboxamide ribotide isomerase
VIVYPAVDIRNGRCVQLTQGRPDTEVVHHDDPAAQAALWVSLGADAIHVVNLDGALSYGAGTASALNLQRVAEIRRAVDVPVQFAGGLRDERDVETAFGLDVDRIVIGTAAVVRPELVAWALRRWGPDRVAVALEVKGGQVVTTGGSRPRRSRPCRSARTCTGWACAPRSTPTSTGKACSAASTPRARWRWPRPPASDW